MVLELGVLPSGHLRCYSTQDKDQTADPRIAKAFADSTGAGLFALAAKDDGSLSPSLVYWREFACQTLDERCKTTQAGSSKPQPLATLPDTTTASLLAGLPPMQGAEYLTTDSLQDIRSMLDGWLCEQIKSHGSLSGFLEKRAPDWHQVGRVCFHLAENRIDPDYPFAFIATYAPKLSGRGRVRHQPLHQALQEYAGARNKQALIRLLSPVQRAADSSALVKELLDSGDLYHPLAWTPAEAYEFLKQSPLFEQCGVVVRLPDWWKKRPRPRVSVIIGGGKQARLDTDTLLDFRLEVALGDETLSKKELKELMQAENGLAFIRGQWVEMDRGKLSEALEHWKQVEAEAGQDGLSFIEGMRMLAGAPVDMKQMDTGEAEHEWAFVQPGAWLNDLLENLRSPQQLQDVDPGDRLKATLRDYQKTGVNWLWLLSQLGLGACLADDMGLGKTMQVISLLLILNKQRRRRPSLLVLPASLLANWKDELDRFAPSLQYRIVHPSQVGKQAIEAMATQQQALAHTDLVMTTYGMLSRQSWLLERDWRTVILDEAQAIKNPSSLQTKAVKKLKGGSRIALTGTPVENRLGDLWSLFDFLCPGLLGSATRFKGFVKSLATRETHQYAPLRRLVGPYILRRLKTDKTIISDLPEKSEVNAYCGLSKAQAVLYKKTVKELATALEIAEGIKRRGLVLAYLMRFKQICNHPSQLLGDGVYDPGHSGKFTRLAELCEEIASRQEKVLVFTQFREITAPLASYLEELFERPGLTLHGGTAVKQRKKLVDRFQQEDGPPFFVLSLKAGGTGLNLTEASHVIHFDRWWNPAVENQATDRAFRIGQHKNVLVHKFVCQGTVEEKIDTMLEEKSVLSSDILEGGGETLLTEMANAELLDMISLDVAKIQV